MDRDEKGRFIKGNKEGKGRIKDSVSINDSVRKILATKDKKTKRKILDAMAEQIVKQAIKGDREFNPTLMIQLWNHIDGSPSQNVNVGGQEDNPIKIEIEYVDSEPEDES